MKIKVRQGVFETNSSSVHCICIRNDGVNLGYNTKEFRKINIVGGCYGWGINELNRFDDKVNYIYQWCYYKDEFKEFSNRNDSYCDRFEDFLMDNGIDYIYVDKEFVKDGYIENCCDWIDITLEDLFANDFDLLKKLLFNDASIIGIRNDNEGFEFEEENLKEYLVYLK